jgi:DNA repair protein RadC
MPRQLSFAYPTDDAPRPRRRIGDLPVEERPLYRLHQVGAGALAATELLALVLGTPDAPGLAEELLARFGSLHRLARAPRSTLTRTRGIGPAQAARLAAVLELSRRLQLPEGDSRPRITCPSDAAALVMPTLRDLQQEELRVILLDTRNRVLGIPTIYKGSLNTSVVRVGEIFRPAIEAPAAAIILAHNHPSGEVAPSPEDLTVTRQCAQAGKLLDVELLDHLIVGGGRYASLKERGLGFD